MKTKKIIVLSGLVLSLLSLSSFKSIEYSDEIVSVEIVQEGFIVYATFDGKKDNVYTFKVKDKNGKGQILTFQNVEHKVLKKIDLNSNSLVGTMYKITFSRDLESANGETKTITKLEKL